MFANALVLRTRAGRAPLLTTSRRSAGMLFLLGVPSLLLVVFAWQVWSGLQPTTLVTREAVALGRAALEADPTGSRIDLVLVDQVGQETTVNGDVTITLREPGGAVWQTTRAVTATDFGALPAGGLLTGRLGYSVVVLATDWLRPPRRGGPATITVGIQPTTSGGAFTAVTAERFP